MKTTMNLPDALLDELKLRAAAQGRTVTSLVEQALRRMLDEPVRAHEHPQFPTWNGGSRDGYLVDIEDLSAVRAVEGGQA